MNAFKALFPESGIRSGELRLTYALRGMALAWMLMSTSLLRVFKGIMNPLRNAVCVTRAPLAPCIRGNEWNDQAPPRRLEHRRKTPIRATYGVQY